MSNRKVLFFSYWYPNKINRIFPVFIKKHAQAIAISEEIQVLSLSIIRGTGLWKVEYDRIIDETGIVTHQVYIRSFIYKLLYFLLPLHEWILRGFIKRRILPEFKFTIIHSNILFPCAIVGAGLSQHFGAKHVITEHWSRLPYFFGKNIYSRRGRRTFQKAGAITVVSGLLEETVRQYTGNSNLFVVPNAINEDDFFIDKTLTKHSVLTFIAVANWTPPKNPRYFLEALETLRRKNEIAPFQLIMVGNGELLERAKKGGYSYPIIYTGILGANELRQQLNRAHVFLHGSDYETFSTVIVEALLCGLPCVVSPVGIATEVINNDNGFVSKNDPEDFERKILQVISAEYQPQVIAAAIQGKYTLPEISKQFALVYDQL